MVQIANPAGNFPVLNGSLPCEGTKAYPFNLDFTAVNAYKIDLTQQQIQKQFTTLQTVWIDNADNTAEFELICTTTGQRIIAPPQSQGFYAMLQPSPPVFSVQTSGALVMEIILLNFYIPPQVTDVSLTVSAGGLPQFDIPALDGVIAGGKLQTQSVPFTTTGLTNASGNVAAANTYQQVIPASATRVRWVISNPLTASEELDIAFGAGPGGAIALAPGVTWDESGSSIVGDEVQVRAATAGHVFTAYYK